MAALVILHDRGLFLQLAASLRIEPSERVGLGVAVRAEHSKVLEAPIVFFTIDMIDLDGDTLAEPRREPALAAAILEDTVPQKPGLFAVPRRTRGHHRL